jgi:hypothetical protein
MRGRVVFFCIVTLLIFVSTVRAQQAPPSPGCVFYGNVYVGGKPAVDGLNVTAVIAGTTLNWTTETNGGAYNIAIPSQNESSPTKDGGESGDSIVFYVQSVQNVQTAIFIIGGGEEFDLSVPPGQGLNMSQSSSTITVSLDCPSTLEGYEITINGRLSFTNGTSISGVNVSLTYLADYEGSWSSIPSVTSMSDGSYHAQMPWNATRGCTIEASWQGNETVEGTEANVCLETTSPDQKHVFSVISNSSVTGLIYNGTDRTLSFDLSGTSGTTAYTNIVVPKDLTGDINGLHVYLDQSIVYYTANSSDDSWLLHFTYQQSSHEVTVYLSSPAQPFLEAPLGIITLATVVIILAISATYLALRRRRQPDKSDKPEQKPRKTSQKKRPPPWKAKKN